MFRRLAARILSCSLAIGLLSATVNAQQVAATLTVGSLPYVVAVDTANGLLYVVNSGANTVSTFDLATHSLLHTTLVGSSPEGIAVGPSGLV